MDWAKHTTVIAAVVAAVGLAVTAWGTVKSAQVADDQLSQSKELDEAESRKLTSHITMWEWMDTWKAGDPQHMQAIANRNLDPAIVFLKIRAEQLEIGPSGKKVPSPAGMLMLGTIPPCTRYDFSTVRIDEYVNEAWDLGFWSIASLVVVEPSGTLWQRLPGGDIRSLTATDRRDIATERKRMALENLPMQSHPELSTDLDKCGSTE